MSELWNNPSQLRALSNFLQSFGIGLVFLGGLLQVGRFIVDRREKALSAAIQAAKERAQKANEDAILARLEDRQAGIAQLKADASELRSTAERLQSQTDALHPRNLPISTGSATIDIVTATVTESISEMPGNVVTSTMFGDDAVLELLSGSTVVLRMTSSQMTAVKTQTGGAEFRFVATLPPDAPGVGRSIESLRHVDTAILSVRSLWHSMEILNGRVTVTINNALKFNLLVDRQFSGQAPIRLSGLASLTDALDYAKAR